MLKRLLALSTTAAVGFTLAAPTPAQACSIYIPSDGLEFESLPAQVELYTDAAVAFNAVVAAVSVEDALGVLTVEASEGGTPIAGTVGWIAGLENPSNSVQYGIVTWTPDAPLAPGSSIELHLVVDNQSAFGSHTFNTDTTVALSVLDQSTPEITVTVDDVSLETHDTGTGERVCCDTDEENMCTGETTRCWHETLTPLPRLRGTFAPPAGIEHSAYVRLLRGVDGDASSAPGQSLAGDIPAGSEFSIDFDEEASSYCVAVEIVKIADGSATVSDTVCVDHAVIAGAEPTANELDLDQCIADPYYEESKEPFQPADEGEGCSCRAGDSSPTAWAWLLLALAVPLRTRRATVR